MIFGSEYLIFRKISHFNEVNMTNYFNIQFPRSDIDFTTDKKFIQNE